MIDRITNAQLTTEALPFAKPLLCARSFLGCGIAVFGSFINGLATTNKG
jgi:hypothetical protein